MMGNTHCKSVSTLRPGKADGSSAFLFSLAGDRFCFMNPTQAQGIGNIIPLDAPEPNFRAGWEKKAKGGCFARAFEAQASADL